MRARRSAATGARRGDASSDNGEALVRSRPAAEADDHRQVTTLGSAGAARDLGRALEGLGRWDEAVEAHRQAGEWGEADAWLDLAIAGLRLERWTEARDAARRAMTLGKVEAHGPLGAALRELGDYSGARAVLEAALRAGDAAAATQLALLLRELGDHRQAEDVAHQAAALGSAVATAVLVHWQWDATGDAGLEADLRASADAYEVARVDLAQLLRRTGRVAEAREVLQVGVDKGERTAHLPLGNLLWDHYGDADAAEAAYRAGVAAGDPYSHHNLGVLLLARGDGGAAIREFGLGAAAGDHLATATLWLIDPHPSR